MGFLSLLLGGQWEVGGGKGAGSLLFLVAVHFNPAATIDSFSSDFVFLRTSHSMTPSETLDQSTSTLSFETEVLALQSFFSRLPGANNPISFFIPPTHPGEVASLSQLSVYIPSDYFPPFGTSNSFGLISYIKISLSDFENKLMITKRERWGGGDR